MQAPLTGRLRDAQDGPLARYENPLEGGRVRFYLDDVEIHNFEAPESRSPSVFNTPLPYSESRLTLH